MKTFQLSIAISLICIFFSCQSAKKLATYNKSERSPLKFDSITADSILVRMANHSAFSYFSAKGECTFTDDNIITEFKINAQLIKDSAYLIILKKLGIEISRILIKKDSISILDRIDQAIYKFDYSGMTSKYSIPFGFGQFYQLISAAGIIDPESEYHFTKTKDQCILRGNSSRIKSIFHLDSFNLLPIKFMVKDSLREMTIHKIKSIQVNEKWLPATLQISIKYSGGRQQTFEINWHELKLDPISSLKFNIPEHYSKHY